MRTLKVLVAVALLASTFALGQQNTPQNQNSSQDQTPPQNQVFLPGPQNESVLDQKIRHSLLTLPYYSIFDDIAFKVEGSTVTLIGECPAGDPWNIKNDAANTVKRIKGVTKVINDIKLLPLSPMDWQIRRAEVKAIYGLPEIGTRYGYQALPSIHIIVDSGHVTLTGVVDNDYDKNLIVSRAKTVPDAISVTDDLRVLHPGNHEKP